MIPSMHLLGLTGWIKGRSLMCQKGCGCEDTGRIRMEPDPPPSPRPKHPCGLSAGTQVRRTFFSGAGLVTQAFVLYIFGVKVHTVNVS